MTKEGIPALTRAVAGNLLARGIRVNPVAPGPVWTPLNPSDKEAPKGGEFGSQAKMGRPAQPEEIARPTSSSPHRSVPATLRPRASTTPAMDLAPGLCQAGGMKPPTASDTFAEIATARIELKDTYPPIWREVEVPTSITLKVLHDIVQVTIGWMDYHLWEFVIDGRTYGLPMDEDRGAAPRKAAAKVRLRDILKPGETVITYTYDFGDDWVHEIRITDIRPGEPGVAIPSLFSKFPPLARSRAREGCSFLHLDVAGSARSRCFDPSRRPSETCRADVPRWLEEVRVCDLEGGFAAVAPEAREVAVSLFGQTSSRVFSLLLLASRL